MGFDDRALIVRGTGPSAASAHDADAFAYAESFTVTDSSTDTDARDADAQRVRYGITNSSDANEHADAGGLTQPQPNAGHADGREHEHGAAGDERRRDGHPGRLE